MKFSIVTPSLNQLPWLKRCIRSVKDQVAGDEREHLVQDGGSDVELGAWVRDSGSLNFRSEPDCGIYDALNKGFARATGEIFSFLNCDEQYLPGTLQSVANAFREHPETDMVVGDFLIIGPDCSLLSFRRATPLRASMILTDHLYDFTCAIFFRRSLFEKTGPFRSDFKAAGDAEWVARALRQRPEITYLPHYLAVFTLTGDNLSAKAEAAAEAQKLRELAPRWAQVFAPALRRVRHLEKWWRGGYRSDAITYEVYASSEATERTRFVAEDPEWRHPWTK